MLLVLEDINNSIHSLYLSNLLINISFCELNKYNYIDLIWLDDDTEITFLSLKGFDDYTKNQTWQERSSDSGTVSFI